MMKKGLSIILEQPTPKPGAKPVFYDNMSPSTTNVGSEEETKLGGISKLLGKKGGSNQFTISDNFTKSPSDPILKVELEDAINDANSNEESARVSKHLGVYNDPDTGEEYLALAGRKKGAKENLYYKVEKQGDEWGFIDSEEGNKWKPLEEY